MQTFYENEHYKILQGSVLDMLDHIAENSIDCIITDPPYEIGFCAKSWDKQGISFNKETWEKCLKVLKPGGYLLSFGACKTYHRIACAIEDGGFEILDCFMWLFGSGFPKSMDLGLAIDKKLGVKSIDTEIVSPNSRPNGSKEKDLYKGGKQGKTFTFKIANNEWGGWGTQVKPCYEPIIVARKPFKTSLVENVLKYGVGGLNINECRLPRDSKLADKKTTAPVLNKNMFYNEGAKRIDYTQNDKRFPTNVIHDGSKEVINNMPFYEGKSVSRYFYCAKVDQKDREEGLEDFQEKTIRARAKYFDWKENNDGTETPKARKNMHPTVKPCSLMQYLVRLVAPKGSTILDCFMGSGSTGKAVMVENGERRANYKFIGIELMSEYCEIAKARIDYALYKYQTPKNLGKANSDKKQITIYEILDSSEED